MNLLLDTHAILWFLADAPNVSAHARAAILDPSNVRWASPISLLEIALKNRLGKLPLPDPFGAMFPASLTASDIHLLPIERVAHRAADPAVDAPQGPLRPPPRRDRDGRGPDARLRRPGLRRL